MEANEMHIGQRCAIHCIHHGEKRKKTTQRHAHTNSHKSAQSHHHLFCLIRNTLACVTKKNRIVFKSMTLKSFERQTIDFKSFLEKCFFFCFVHSSIPSACFWLSSVHLYLSLVMVPQLQQQQQIHSFGMLLWRFPCSSIAVHCIDWQQHTYQFLICVLVAVSFFVRLHVAIFLLLSSCDCLLYVFHLMLWSFATTPS